MRAAALGWLMSQGIALPLAAFILIGGIVFISGTRLTRHADAVAGTSALGRLWIGTLLLAASTSLPELTTDVAAAALRAPNLGIGDLMGSSLANMLILALLDLIYLRRRVLDDISRNHLMVGVLAIILTALAGVDMAAGGWGALGPIGIGSALIALIYLLGMRAVRAELPPATPPVQLSLGATRRTELRQAIIGFAVVTLVLGLATPALVLSAEALARVTGLGETFVGTLLVGLTTSIPEGVTIIAAVRLGALDLAAGNVFGSNAFNMCIPLAMDLASPAGPVLPRAARANLIGAQLAVLVTALILLRMLTPRSRAIGRWRVESLLVLIAYGAAAWLLAPG